MLAPMIEDTHVDKLADVSDRIFATCNRGVNSLHEACEPVNADTQHIEKVLADRRIKCKKGNLP